ncbi:MAG TPA: Spy/CpxP family protein refolding chaperone [Polyangiaceae bacterium]|jgi:Spy/CpxP family protein refolding chaperone
MHPGFFGWWHRHGSGHGSCAEQSCGPASFGDSAGRPHWHAAPQHGFDEGGSGFGVRRPLRFLAHKLELNDDQVSKLAAILSSLKTERAQNDVDQRRRVAALADAFELQTFDEAGVDGVGAEQHKSEERLRAAVKTALSRIHALLSDEQRQKFAYLLRTGVLAI